jgi:hypothetical protein
MGEHRNISRCLWWCGLSIRLGPAVNRSLRALRPKPVQRNANCAIVDIGTSTHPAGDQIMPLRKALCTACAATLTMAAPSAFANDSVEVLAADDIAGKLADPGSQIAATVALTALSEMLLDLNIEPIRRAMASVDPYAGADLPPDARLRDLAGPGAAELPGEIGRRVPQTMGAAAGMIGAFQNLMPELQATVDRMRHALPGQAVPGQMVPGQ